MLPHSFAAASLAAHPSAVGVAWTLAAAMSNLLLRVAAGEQAAFKACIDQYGRMIWGLARKLSPTPADAEDATQEVFLQLWKNAQQFDPTRGSEAIFIVTLTRRTLINRYRNSQRQPRAVSVEELADTGWEPSITNNHDEQIAAQQAAAALRELTPDAQRVIRLAVVSGLSQSEIATHTGLPLGTVKTLMRRGFMAVRARLTGGATATAATEVTP